jgi:hypothetical protein
MPVARAFLAIHERAICHVLLAKQHFGATSVTCEIHKLAYYIQSLLET